MRAFPALAFTACIACSLLVYVWMPDTRWTSRIDRDPA